MRWDDITRRALGLGGGGTAALERDPRPRGKIGLALGAGAARGWAHIGVLRVLEGAGIVPDVIAGCSVGAVVGGCHAAGKLDEVEAFARSLDKRRVMGLLDFHIGGSGLIAGHRLRRLLERDLSERRIEDLPVRVAAVATELGTGHEIWLSRGPLVDGMRASYALPGLFDPVKLGRRWLMDGALVNPIPITAARALGADVVLCVNLNGDLRLRGTVIQPSEPDVEPDEMVEAVMDEPPRRGLFNPMLDAAERLRRGGRRAVGPGIASVMVDAFNITQDRVARSRLAGDPPDAMVCPKLASIGLFEFHRAAEAIELGRAAAERSLPDVLDLVGERARAAG